jgi:ABC-type spermidine/putrescine transport system permease subunit II
MKDECGVRWLTHLAYLALVLPMLAIFILAFLDDRNLLTRRHPMGGPR